MSEDIEIREVAADVEPVGERVQESVWGDVAATVSAVSGLSGYGALYYARAQHHLQRQRAEAEAVERELETAALRRELELENRRLRAELYGLDALDDWDRFGPDGY